MSEADPSLTLRMTPKAVASHPLSHACGVTAPPPCGGAFPAGEPFALRGSLFAVRFGAFPHTHKIAYRKQVRHQLIADLFAVDLYLTGISMSSLSEG